jgi:hypothetical protein
MWSIYSPVKKATAGVSKKSGSVVFQNKGAVRLRFDTMKEMVAFIDYLIAMGYDINELDIEPVTDEWVLEHLI